MVFTEHLLAKAVCTMSIKVLGRQPGAPKSREHRSSIGLYGTLTSQSSVYKVRQIVVIF